ncbi:IS110 family transposase [Streptomyces shenzhenensis]|uniref:IS110 family transposase n=1 Tax=Streptomyces shenzhenensis TaxID=943815 RepID=A0A3M0HS00_9ACTN|nr:IS110 family transposase [Streptomyces shenzhenensis]RMB79375.1 IS110 family transposase [Streptomyces shenzhenensis]
MNTTVAHTRSFVIGVDTHARTHTYAVLAANGEHLDTETFPNTHAGRARAINWVGRRTGGDLGALWVIEGIGSYGVQIARQSALAGYRVAEAARMGRGGRRGIGKSDPIDARRIAAAVLPLTEKQLRNPRMDEGIRAAAQILLTARDELTGERTRAVNALTALVRTADLGIDARRSLGAKKVGEIARWRPREEDLATATARTEAVRLAKRILVLDAEITDNTNRIGELVDASPAAELVEETGIGPVTAATVLVAWSHPGRIRSEAAFAALAGVSPLPASSGNTTRHRLNRGGDRRLNRALNVVAMVRMVHHPQTRAYADRRRTEGKTDREIRRCLKRYLARRFYRHLNSAATAMGVDGI